MAALCFLLASAAFCFAVYAWIAATDADLARQHCRKLETELERLRQTRGSMFEEWRGDDGSQPDGDWWREGKHPYGEAG